jgi:hypothetical protein
MCEVVGFDWENKKDENARRSAQPFVLFTLNR